MWLFVLLCSVFAGIRDMNERSTDCTKLRMCVDMVAGLEGDDVRRGSSANEGMGTVIGQTVPGSLGGDFIARHLGRRHFMECRSTIGSFIGDSEQRMFIDAAESVSMFAKGQLMGGSWFFPCSELGDGRFMADLIGARDSIAQFYRFPEGMVVLDPGRFASVSSLVVNEGRCLDSTLASSWALDVSEIVGGEDAVPLTKIMASDIAICGWESPGISESARTNVSGGGNRTPIGRAVTVTAGCAGQPVQLFAVANSLLGWRNFVGLAGGLGHVTYRFSME
jgi:hypothetical protein